MSKVLSYQQFLESSKTKGPVANVTKEGRHYVIECDGKVEKVDTSDLDESDDNGVAKRIVEAAMKLGASRLMVEGIKDKVVDTMKTLFRNSETTDQWDYVMQGGTDTKHKD
jgi:hypothetical protein